MVCIRRLILLTLIILIVVACKPEATPPAKGKSNGSALGYTVKIGKVVRDSSTPSLPPSVPPGATREVDVTITGTLPPGGTVNFDIINGNDTNGTASVDSTTISLTASGKIKIIGGNQNAPQHGQQLQIRAKDSGSGAEMALSDGFGVCAHPQNWSLSSPSNINGPCELDYNGNYYGLSVLCKWESDGVPSSPLHNDLTEVAIKEVLSLGTVNRPPFPAVSNSPTDYQPGSDQWIGDTFAIERAAISAGPAGIYERLQLSAFKCNRCGASEVAVKNSGVIITHRVKLNAAGKWVHTTECAGKALTIGGLSSDAATIVNPPMISPEHPLP